MYVHSLMMNIFHPIIYCDDVVEIRVGKLSIMLMKCFH